MYSNINEVSSLLLTGSESSLDSSALVAEELGVHTLGGDVSLALGLLDAVSVLL